MLTADLGHPDRGRGRSARRLSEWLLAFPHDVVLIVLSIGGLGVWVIAWFAILFTGRYPRPLSNDTVGLGRWSLRGQAYAFLLVTERFPPFSLR